MASHKCRAKASPDSWEAPQKGDEFNGKFKWQNM